MSENLRSALTRLQSQSAFEILGVPPHATGESVRAAFLSLTKRFHPNRYARESAEVNELATEIFLLIRKAYSVVGDDAKRQALRERMMGVRVPATATTPLAGTSVPPTQPPVGPAHSGAKATVTLPTQPPIGPAPTARPSLPPPAQTARPAAPVAPTTQRPAGAAAPPAPTRSTKPIPPRPAPQTTPPGASATKPEVQALLEAAKTRQSRLDSANQMLSEGKYTEARETLRKLTAEDPQSRKLRQRFQLALGLEHRAARRLDEAVRELERALGLDPTAEDVAEALQRTREQRDAGRSGLFSKIFGR